MDEHEPQERLYIHIVRLRGERIRIEQEHFQFALCNHRADLLVTAERPASNQTDTDVGHRVP